MPGVNVGGGIRGIGGMGGRGRGGTIGGGTVTLGAGGSRLPPPSRIPNTSAGKLSLSPSVGPISTAVSAPTPAAAIATSARASTPHPRLALAHMAPRPVSRRRTGRPRSCCHHVNFIISSPRFNFFTEERWPLRGHSGHARSAAHVRDRAHPQPARAARGHRGRRHPHAELHRAREGAPGDASLHRGPPRHVSLRRVVHRVCRARRAGSGADHPVPVERVHGIVAGGQPAGVHRVVRGRHPHRCVREIPYQILSPNLSNPHLDPKRLA